DRLHDPPATWKHLLTAFEHWAADPRILASFKERAKKRAADRERRRIMITPTDPRAAIKVAHQTGEHIPTALSYRLIRLANPISPTTIIEQARVWRKCQICRGDGMVGDALSKTLAFCECCAGQERRLRDGTDYPQIEIVRVNATIQSRLVAAAHDC